MTCKLVILLVCVTVAYGLSNALLAQSSDSLLSSESIFDSLAVTLTVNGSDGPVHVAAGSRLTLHWQSEGATRCRGNWSKDDIALSGTRTGRINKSTIVKIACIDADWERAEDSVVVQVSITPVTNVISEPQAVVPNARVITTPQPPPSPPPPPPPTQYTPAVSERTTVSSGSTLTAQITNLLNDTKTAGLSSTGGTVDPMLASLLRQRKEAMVKLAKENPVAFLADVIPTDARSRAPQSLQKNIEQETTLTGTLEVYHVDDFKNHENSRYDYFLNVTSAVATGGRAALKSTNPTASGKDRIQIFPLDDFPAVSGTVIKMKGYRIENVAVPHVGRANLQSISDIPALDSVGEQKTLVVIVGMSSQAPTLTEAKAKEVIFSRGHAFQKFFLEQSNDKVWFTGDVRTIVLDRSPDYNSCGSGVFIRDNDVIDALMSQNVDLAKYGRIFFLPPTGYCSAVGKGIYYNIRGREYRLSESWVSSSNIEYAFDYHQLDGTLVHEVGHALGLWHANSLVCDGGEVLRGDKCENREYGNPFDFMGTGGGHFNAFYKKLLGWLDPSQTARIRSSGRYTLTPLEQKGGTPLAVFVSSVSGEPLFAFEYRPTVFGGPDGVGNGRGILVSLIQSPREAIGNSYRSQLLNMNPAFRPREFYSLNLGAVWTDPDSGLSIEPVGVARADGISFDATVGLPQCIRYKPSIFYMYAPKYVFAGQQSSIGFILRNEDSESCPGSVFVPALSELPDGWAYEVSKTETILPQDYTYYNISLMVPLNVSKDTRTVTLTVNGQGGLPTTRKLTLNIVPAVLINRIEPREAKIEEKIVVSGQFPSGETMKLFVSYLGGSPQYSNSRREMNVVSTDGKTFSFTVPNSLERCDPAWVGNGKCPIISVPTPAGLYLLQLNHLSFDVFSDFLIVAGKPDLTIKPNLNAFGIVIRGASGNPPDAGQRYEGETYLSGYGQNVGVLAIPEAFTTSFEMSVDNKEWFTLVDRPQQKNVQPTETFIVNSPRFVFPNGVFYFRFCVDSTNVIEEEDETDNCLSGVKVEFVPRQKTTSTSIFTHNFASPFFVDMRALFHTLFRGTR